MTKEPPKGLRANLRSTYAKMDDDKLRRTCKPGDFRKMLFGGFGLCELFSNVQMSQIKRK